MKREELRNDAKLIGEIVHKDVRRNNVGTADETIAVELKVRTGETEEHIVSFFAYKYGKNDKNKREMKDEKISKLYTGYDTMAKEYNFIGDEKGDGTGEKVEVTGSLVKNKYVNSNSGEFTELDKIKGTFCSRMTDLTKYTPCAVWNAHMHITKIDEEAKDKTGEFTRVMGMVVDYVEDEFEFRIYNEKIRKQFSTRFEKGDSTRFEGNIVNRPDVAVEVEEDDEDAFGEKMDVSANRGNTIRRRYLEIITGSGKIMDTEEESHPLNKEKIKEYRQNIAKRKADTISKHEDKQKESNNAPRIDPNAGTGSLDDEDIPF